MNIDCHWVAANLESYFCDQLTTDERRLARSHIEKCADCRNEVEGLNRLDLHVKRYFKEQLALARSPQPQRSRLALGAAGIAVAALITLAVVLQYPMERTDQTVMAPAVISSPTTTPSETTVAKDPQLPEAFRSKPDVMDASPAGRVNGAHVDSNSGLDFVVIDPAGYIRTLQDYGGYVLLVGVWGSNESQSATNLERIYKDFGANPRMRVLGASNDQGKPPNTTFPVVYNHGSTLWGTSPGDFVLLDQTGQLKLRGSLVSDFERLSQSLRTTLQNR
jgi:hypothetical protein